MSETKPMFVSGSVAYDGHECAPIIISDAHGIVAGRFGVNPENASAAKAMLEAAYQAGLRAGKLPAPLDTANGIPIHPTSLAEKGIKGLAVRDVPDGSK